MGHASPKVSMAESDPRAESDEVPSHALLTGTVPIRNRDWGVQLMSGAIELSFALRRVPNRDLD